MAPPQNLDPTFRAQIRTDVKAAWTAAVAIHDGPPRLSKTGANYPYAVVLQTDFRQVQAGLRRVTQTYTYEITYVAAIPATGILDPIKIALANTLMTRLMTGNLYAGIQGTRMVAAIDIQGGRFNDTESPTYEVSLTFEIVADGLY